MIYALQKNMTMGKTQVMLLLLFTVWFAGCGVIETVFKAGMWWAFILIGLACVMVMIVARKVGKK
jgi:uncharacterized membrane protein